MPPDSHISTGPQIAEGRRCAGCDYDLAGLTSANCPECGQEILKWDDQRRREIVAQRQLFARQWQRRAVFRWIIVLGPGVVALIATALRHGNQLLYIGMGLGMAALLSVPLPTIRTSACAIEDHGFRTAIWLLLAPFLHLPWVVWVVGGYLLTTWISTPIWFFLLLGVGWLAGPASLIAFSSSWSRNRVRLGSSRIGEVGVIQVIALWMLSWICGGAMFMLATMGV